MTMRLTGWPRRFECERDEGRARRHAAQIKACLEHYTALQRPHSPQEIAAIVELLQLRGFEKDIPISAQTQINREWIIDLQSYPADLVNKAYQNWRRGNNKRAPYAAGELMDSVKAELARRKALCAKAKSVLAMIEPKTPDNRIS